MLLKMASEFICQAFAVPSDFFAEVWSPLPFCALQFAISENINTSKEANSCSRFKNGCIMINEFRWFLAHVPVPSLITQFVCLC